MSFVSYSRTIDWILNCNKNKNTKPTSLKTIFIFKSQFTVAAIIINHELKLHLDSSTLMSKHFPELDNGLLDNVSSKMQSARQHLILTLNLPFCLWRFSSMCWTDDLNKKTLKHTRRKICVDGGWLFLWRWLYFDQEVVLTCVHV